jgi:hypothetical protein
MESMNEFIEEAKKMKPENDSVFVHVRGWIKDDGAVEYGYSVATALDGVHYFNTPELALTMFRNSHYPEIEPVQTDILLPKEGE